MKKSILLIGLMVFVIFVSGCVQEGSPTSRQGEENYRVEESDVEEDYESLIECAETKTCGEWGECTKSGAVWTETRICTYLDDCTPPKEDVRECEAPEEDVIENVSSNIDSGTTISSEDESSINTNQDSITVISCGGPGEPCCENSECDSGGMFQKYGCINNVCTACGDVGQVCCEGNTCTSLATLKECIDNVCIVCGNIGKPCCWEDDTCMEGTCINNVCE